MSRAPDSQYDKTVYSVGICASDSSPMLPELMRFMLSEQPPNHLLNRLIVVASGCPEETLARAREIALSDSRVIILEEEKRTGKASAINNIIRLSTGEFVVLANSDAKPSTGSIMKLFSTIESDQRIGSVSAKPVLRPSQGVTHKLLSIIWSNHNESSLILNHARLSNHNCDELMVVRLDLLNELPEDVVNDGAYIGGVIHRMGYLVNFCEAAPVEIDVPTNVLDLIRQRRRILFGHIQVWSRLGRPPRTLESLLLTKPAIALEILRSTMLMNPVSLLFLPLASVVELLAGVLAIADKITGGERHIVWRRYSS